MWLGGPNGEFVFCAACGAYSRERSRLLRAPCRGRPSTSGRRALLRPWGPDALPAGWQDFDKWIEQETAWTDFLSDIDGIFDDANMHMGWPTFDADRK